MNPSYQEELDSELHVTNHYVTITSEMSNSGCIPFVGYGIYEISSRLCEKKPLIITFKNFSKVFLFLVILTFSCDIYSCFYMPVDRYQIYNKRLPLSYSIVEKKHKIVSLNKSLKNQIKDENIKNTLESKKIALQESSNIFLFVIEA